MTHLVCLKCGSKKVDDGTSKLFIVLGAALLLAGIYGFSCCLNLLPCDVWDNFVPLENEEILPGLLTFCFGMHMLFQGLTRSERVRCLKCGTVWTPPRRHLRHAV